MSLSEISSVIDRTNPKYCNYEYKYLLTDKVTNSFKIIRVLGTSLLATKSVVESLVSGRIIVKEID